MDTGREHETSMRELSVPTQNPEAKLWIGLVIALMVGCAVIWAVWGFRWPPTASVVAEEQAVTDDLQEPVPYGGR